jgi:hypothetical protein
MSLQIRRAALDSDRGCLIKLIKRHLATNSNERRFGWLYCDGPHGVARAWVLCDNGALVGTAAAFPRKMYFDGQERTGFVFGDFCMDQQYRSLGPAVQLQRKCLEEIDKEPFEISYDFPSQSMLAVYHRLGIHQTGAVVRWAKVLHADRLIKSLVRSPLLTRGFSAIANAALARWGWRGKESECELHIHEGRCGAEFSHLDSQLRCQRGIKTVRSAEYLNWRYLGHPGIRYEILTARRADELIGYVIFREKTEDADIADLCSVEEPSVVARLLWGVTDLLRRRGITTVSLNAGSCHPWNPIFARVGFRRREQSPLIVYSANGRHTAGAARHQNWYLMNGERES